MDDLELNLEQKRGERILLAVEAAPTAPIVIGAAARLAQRLQAEVIVLSVRERAHGRGFAWDVRPPGEIAEVVSHAIYQMQRLGLRVRGLIGKARLDRVAEEIVYAALRYRADEIVLGSSQRSKLASLFFSSVSPRVLRLSPLPVVTVPTRPGGGLASKAGRGSRRYQPAA